MAWLTKYKQHHNRRPGATLVELVIGITIFALISGAMWGLFSSTIQLVRFNENRVSAIAIANTHMEIIKNLPYDDIGTIGGVPSGNLLAVQSQVSNDATYTVTYDIRYIDDSYDDLAPTDTLNTDYKRVRVDVSWSNPEPADPVTLVTNIVPDGLETATSGGTLWVEVFDPSLQPSEPVQNATVQINAPTVDPAVSIVTQTDENGRYILPGAPAGIEAYEVIITKDGYSSAQTYARDAITNPNPQPAHLNILDGDVTVEYFQISPLVNSLTVRMQEDDDKVTLCHNQNGAFTTITVSTNSVDTHIVSHGDYLGFCDGEYDQTKDPVDTTFSIHGEDIIGTDGEGLPIYKYNETFTTGADGEEIIQNLNADTYHIIYDEETEGYVITAHSLQIPIIALPGSNQAITYDLAIHEPYTALLNIVDADELILTDATVRMYSDDLSYDVTQESYHYGQTFFDGLSAETYNIEISQTGYVPYSGTLSINGNENQIITLAAE